MKEGDRVTVFDPAKRIVVRARVRRDGFVEPNPAGFWYAAFFRGRYVLKLAMKDEGRLWARGHSDDAAATLLLVQSAH